MGIGMKLRARRQDLQLTRSQLAEKIHVTPSAIANYENGVSYPKPDILISLLMALEIDANYLYQDYLSNSKVRTLYGQELTSAEEDSIRKYRGLDEQSKRLVHLVIEAEYKRNLNEEWIEVSCLQPGIRKLGSAFLLQDKVSRVKLKKKNMPEGLEFCFQIQIDHYQPVFNKYDVLALNHKPAEHNEIGLFHLNGIYYIRTLYHVGEVRKLRALNVIEPDIELGEDDKLECLGTVLGRIYGTYEMMHN